MSAFDPDVFMADTQVGALDTRIQPIPAGEYPAIVEDFKFRGLPGRDGGPDRQILEVTWSIISDELKATLGREKLTSRQSIWLDLTPDNRLDMGKGKNVGLGKLRAAIGQNDPNTPWALGHIKGAGPAQVVISHRPDKNDDSIMYDEVKTVGKLPS